MPHNRFYTTTPLIESDPYSYIDELAEIHHLQHVMKCEVGQKVEVVDGKGALGFGTIVEFGKQRKSSYCKIEIDRIEREEKKRAEAVFMALSITRAPVLDIALEKCTELGASGFYLFPAERTDKAAYQSALASQKNGRHEQILRSALKQSGALFLPEYQIVSSLEEAFKVIPGYHYFSDISPDASSSNLSIESKKELLNKTLFIGPEKGWSESERALFNGSQKPRSFLSLSKSILRAETAAIVGCYKLICSI